MSDTGHEQLQEPCCLFELLSQIRCPLLCSSGVRSPTSPHERAELGLWTCSCRSLKTEVAALCQLLGASSEEVIVLPSLHVALHLDSLAQQYSQTSPEFPGQPVPLHGSSKETQCCQACQVTSHPSSQQASSSGRGEVHAGEQEAAGALGIRRMSKRENYTVCCREQT